MADKDETTGPPHGGRTLGSVAYAARCTRSCVTLPAWDDLPAETRADWETIGLAVAETVRAEYAGAPCAGCGGTYTRTTRGTPRRHKRRDGSRCTGRPA